MELSEEETIKILSNKTIKSAHKDEEDNLVLEIEGGLKVQVCYHCCGGVSLYSSLEEDSTK